MRPYKGLIRLYSSAAATASVSATASALPKGPAAPANVFTSLILSRIPIVTPELSEFEKAYYHYQDELERRLMWTFPQYYYFKKGSLSERKFVAAQRGPVVKQPGVFYPRGEPDVKFNRERRFKQEVVVPRDAEGSGDGKDESFTRPIEPNSRKTKADETNDIKSLIRRLDRTLYLVVKDGSGKWKFPTGVLSGPEHLHIGAERIVREIGGPDMNTWTVSNTPCAVVNYTKSGSIGGDVSSITSSTDASNIKEFFIKSHILDGQFIPQSKGLDFAWLTKEELGDHVDQAYYQSIKPVLSDQ